MSSSYQGCKKKQAAPRLFEFGIGNYSSVVVSATTLGEALNKMLHSRRLTNHEKLTAMQKDQLSTYDPNEQLHIDWD